MPDEVTLGITCPDCKTRNVLIVTDFQGREPILFKCVQCGYAKEYRHPHARRGLDAENDLLANLPDGSESIRVVRKKA